MAARDLQSRVAEEDASGQEVLAWAWLESSSRASKVIMGAWFV